MGWQQTEDEGCPRVPGVISVTACGTQDHDHGTMMKRRQLIGSRVLALLLVGSLAADVLLKDVGDMQQLMWACYWASACVVAGVFFRSDALVSWGVIFFAGLGLPAWLVGVAIYRDVQLTSVLMHTVPLLAGLYYMSGMTAMPRYSYVGAWLLYVVPFGLSWRFCSAEAMINLSHWVQRPLRHTLPSNAAFYSVLLVLSAVMVLAAYAAMQYVLLRRSDLTAAALPAAAEADVRRS